MVYSLFNGKDLQEIVRMGIACGTTATINPGTELIKMDDVEKLYKWLTRKTQKAIS